MQLLPGFRDFYPDDCARRNYILSRWREVARRYGFVEYDGPILEPMELYKKKSGGEIVGQLFDFTDKGERHVAMRPEMTPTLARMVSARERDFKKPLKWFSIAQFFRYEKPQRGRGREFYQLNCDIVGEPSVAADAEMIALSVDLLRSFGFDGNDFIVRVSNREAWRPFLEAKSIAPERTQEFLDAIDKLQRDEHEAAKRLAVLQIDIAEVKHFVENQEAGGTAFGAIREELRARGLEKFVEFDLTIVRGLAYYTGFVFEVFDRGHELRSLTGGGRYDKLFALMSDNRIDLPALGFGMGDWTLGELIDATPLAAQKMHDWIAQKTPAQIYVIIAKEERRTDAIADVQRLRDAGFRVDYSLVPAKVGKQFQTAEHLGATVAILFGDEWPQVKFKVLATREEFTVSQENLLAKLDELKLQAEKF